jgi:hypothetical protein
MKVRVRLYTCVVDVLCGCVDVRMIVCMLCFYVRTVAHPTCQATAAAQALPHEGAGVCALACVPVFVLNSHHLHGCPAPDPRKAMLGDAGTWHTDPRAHLDLDHIRLLLIVNASPTRMHVCVQFFNLGYPTERAHAWVACEHVHTHTHVQ